MKADIPNLIKCIRVDDQARITIDGSTVESYIRENDDITLVTLCSGKKIRVFDEIEYNNLVCCDLDDCIGGKYKLEGRPVLSDPDYSNLVSGRTLDGQEISFDGFALEGYAIKKGKKGYVELYFHSGDTVRVKNDFESGKYYDCRAEDILPQCITERYVIKGTSDEVGCRYSNLVTAKDILGFDVVCFDVFSISCYEFVGKSASGHFSIEVTFNSGRVIDFPCDGSEYNECPELEDLLNYIIDGKYRSYWKAFPTVINQTDCSYVENLMEGVFRLTPGYQLENIGRTVHATEANPESITIMPEKQADQCSYLLKILSNKDNIISWTFHEVFHHNGEDTVQEICDGITDITTGKNIPDDNLEIDGFKMFNRTDCHWARCIMKDIFKYNNLSDEQKAQIGDSLTVYDYSLDEIMLTKSPDSANINEDYLIATDSLGEDGRIEWTFYRMVSEEDGSAHGEFLCDGASYYCPGGKV